jgi:hypothetical protein
MIVWVCIELFGEVGAVRWSDVSGLAGVGAPGAPPATLTSTTGTLSGERTWTGSLAGAISSAGCTVGTANDSFLQVDHDEGRLGFDRCSAIVFHFGWRVVRLPVAGGDVVASAAVLASASAFGGQCGAN